jgi:nitroimidazol reductase NimA-like FMN-containing flavoprotein (pyridoxamine 5'-phosphate oxidase superfamily)
VPGHRGRDRQGRHAQHLAVGHLIRATERTRLVRRKERASYQRSVIHAILDEALYCHVGYVLAGQPYVIPTVHARVGERLYLHGAVASRTLRTAALASPLCVTVTLLDGLVLARSAFNHSMNYRSVVVLGRATIIDDPVEKLEALRRLSEHIIPGRWVDSRLPNQRELKATTILRLPIEEFSAKVRQGPVVDDAEDLSYPTWAGTLPLPTVPGTPIPDEKLDAGIELPDYVRNYTRNA